MLYHDDQVLYHDDHRYCTVMNLGMIDVAPHHVAIAIVIHRVAILFSSRYPVSLNANHMSH